MRGILNEGVAAEDVSQLSKGAVCITNPHGGNFVKLGALPVVHSCRLAMPLQDRYVGCIRCCLFAVRGGVHSSETDSWGAGLCGDTSVVRDG